MTRHLRAPEALPRPEVLAVARALGEAMGRLDAREILAGQVAQNPPSVGPTETTRDAD